MSKTTSSRTFKIRLELDTLNYTSPVLEIEAESWEEVCSKVFGDELLNRTECDKSYQVENIEEEIEIK